MGESENVCDKYYRINVFRKSSNDVGVLCQDPDHFMRFFFGEKVQVEALGRQVSFFRNEINATVSFDAAEPSVSVLEVRSSITFKGQHPAPIELVVLVAAGAHVLYDNSR